MELFKEQMWFKWTKLKTPHEDDTVVLKCVVDN
jgi:hypothetical protein